MPDSVVFVYADTAISPQRIEGVDSVDFGADGIPELLIRTKQAARTSIETYCVLAHVDGMFRCWDSPFLEDILGAATGLLRPGEAYLGGCTADAAELSSSGFDVVCGIGRTEGDRVVYEPERGSAHVSLVPDVEHARLVIGRVWRAP